MDVKNMEQNNATQTRKCVVVIIHIFIHMKKYVNCSICPFTLHITTNVQTLCWSKTLLVLRFQALIV